MSAAVTPGRRVLLVVVPVVVVVAFLVIVLATREPAANREVDSPLLGLPAPGIVGTTLDGDDFDLADLRGRYVLVNFFATWCVPCQREHDDLDAFRQRHAASGDAEVVSIVFDDSASNVADFFADNGGDWPVVVGDQGGLALDYGVAKIPESYLVAPNGVVVAKIIGGVTVDGLESILARVEGRAG